MARNKANQRNIDKSDLANYPDARIRNNTGSNDGTPISEAVYGDIHETFAKFMREAGLNYNNLPDNVSNGYQLFEAIKRVAAKNDFIGSATKQGNDTVYFDAPLNIFKDKESMIFNVNFDSTDALNKAICPAPNFSKTLVISGAFKSGQKVRLINEASRVVVSGIYETNDVPNLLQRLTSLESVIGTMNKIITPIVNGGTPLLWMRPANEIPEGYQEVTEFRGKSLIGFDPNDNDFNIIMKEIGSKTFTINKTNLPSNINTELMKFKNKQTTSLGIKTGTDFYAEAENVGGSGTEIKKLDPSRIVMFIKYTG